MDWERDDQDGDYSPYLGMDSSEIGEFHRAQRLEGLLDALAASLEEVWEFLPRAQRALESAAQDAERAGVDARNYREALLLVEEAIKRLKE